MSKEIIFTEKEISVLIKEKTYNPFPKVRQRYEVLYLKSQGYKNKEIERIISISHGTITNYLNLYRQGGLRTLNYKGQKSRLHRYDKQLKASFVEKPVGTLKEAKARIKEITDVDLSLTQVKYHLDRLGLKRRKVKQIPDKMDVEKQETFKKEQLEPLIEQAKNGEFHFFLSMLLTLF